MNLKKIETSLTCLHSNLDTLYLEFQICLNSMLQIVDKKNDFQGHYNPKKHKIIDCEDIKAFKEFQSLQRGFTSFFYYNSLILSSYSLFEFSLKKICFLISDHMDSENKFEDKSKGVIDNCKKYIERTLLIKWPDKELDKFWVEIKKVSKLRNLIAHHNGNLKIDKKISLVEQHNYNVFKSDKRLIIFDNGQVFIDDEEYIQSFVKASQGYINRLVEIIKTAANTTQSTAA